MKSFKSYNGDEKTIGNAAPTPEKLFSCWWYKLILGT